MRPPRSNRTRLLVLPIAAALLIAACGGGSDGDSTDAAAANGGSASADGEGAEADVFTTAGIDLGGTEIDPASEIESNLFPDLVVDDIGRGKKVNIRNIVPSDKPVLLWMWAPH